MMEITVWHFANLVELWTVDTLHACCHLSLSGSECLVSLLVDPDRFFRILETATFTFALVIPSYICTQACCMIGQQCGLWLWSFISWARCSAQLGNLYLEYCTFCCTTWKSLSEILHFLLHCLKIFISNAALSTALKRKKPSKKNPICYEGHARKMYNLLSQVKVWFTVMTHITPCTKKSEKINELGRKKLGQTHAVGKECKAIVSLSPDRDSPRQLWGLCRGNHDFCIHSTPPCEPNRWEAAATYVCVCAYWSKLDTGVNLTLE